MVASSGWDKFNNESSSSDNFLTISEVKCLKQFTFYSMRRDDKITINITDLIFKHTIKSMVSLHQQAKLHNRCINDIWIATDSTRKLHLGDYLLFCKFKVLHFVIVEPDADSRIAANTKSEY